MVKARFKKKVAKVQSKGLVGMMEAIVVSPLGRARCLRINSALGLIAVVASLAFYLVAQGKSELRFPVEAIWAVAGWGGALLLVRLLAMLSERLQPIALFIGGLLIAFAVMAYTAFMIVVARALIALPGPGGAQHLVHIPGILAGGLAYSLRLVVAFRPGRKACEKGDGQRTAKVGLILGAICDMVVLGFVAWTFFR